METVPPGSGFDVATLSEGGNDNDFNLGPNSVKSLLVLFPPTDNQITVPLTIFGDELPENTEAVQLTLEAPTDTIGESPPPRFELLPEYPSFFVIITDKYLVCKR